MNFNFDKINNILNTGAYFSLAKKINQGNIKAIELVLKINRQLDHNLNLKIAKINKREEINKRVKELEKLPTEDIIAEINQVLRESHYE